MKDEKEEDRSQRIALFRYGLIADLTDREVGQRGLYVKLREKAGRSYSIPYSRRTRVAEETLRDWLVAWRRGGFEALRPKPRGDLGQTRGIPGPVADLLVSIKDEKHSLSVLQVIERARATGAVPEDLALPNSTVHRLLSRAGMMRKRPEEPNGNDRRRFSFEKAGELWMADVMHGPTVGVEGGRRRKSYLIGIIDDATRVVPYCAFALSEAVGAFLPVFGQAVRRRGVPVRLYCDCVTGNIIAVMCRLGLCGESTGPTGRIRGGPADPPHNLRALAEDRPRPRILREGGHLCSKSISSAPKQWTASEARGSEMRSGSTLPGSTDMPIVGAV